jgi:hypothetical protein
MEIKDIDKRLAEIEKMRDNLYSEIIELKAERVRENIRVLRKTGYGTCDNNYYHIEPEKDILHNLNFYGNFYSVDNNVYGYHEDEELYEYTDFERFVITSITKEQFLIALDKQCNYLKREYGNGN